MLTAVFVGVSCLWLHVPTWDQWFDMRKYFTGIRPGSVLRLLPLLLGLLAILALLGMRLIAGAEWNSWALHYMWHALGTQPARQYPSSIPAGHDRAGIWLAQDALTSGNTQQALLLVEPGVLQDDPFALHIQAAAMQKEGNFDGALQALIHVQDYNLLIEFGGIMARANFQAVALAAFNAAWAIDPVMGVLPLADYLANDIADLPGAEVVLKRALATYPVSSGRISWYRRLGDNLRRQERFAEAEAVYLAALIENPDDRGTHIGLGWVYYDQGQDLQLAIEQFQKAIAIDETFGDGYFAVAQVLTREERFVEADYWYRQALLHDQTHNTWYITRANNARSSGNLGLALSIYQETARMFPGYSAVYFEMALAYRLDADPEEAQDAILKALSLMDPPNELYYVRAGQIFEWSGETNRALEAYRNALLINPENTIARKAVSRLGGP